MAARLRAARVAALLQRPSSGAAKGEVDELQGLVDRTAALYAQGINESTRKTYARRWRLFEDWCSQREWSSLPAAPETVMLYLADALDQDRGAALGTLRGWLAAINRVHVEAGESPPGQDPAMRLYLRSLSRITGTRPPRTPVSALRVAELRQVCRALDAVQVDPTEVRDRSLLGLHRAGLGDGELARLLWTDLRVTRGSVRIDLRSPRGDRPDRRIRLEVRRGVVGCPVAALRAWQALADPDVPWVFTLINRQGSQSSEPWDGRAIRRIRIARLDSLGPPGRRAEVSTAMSLLGGRPSLVLRDKALLLLGFAGAFRRPDLVGLTWRDLSITEEGIIVHLRRSKTDLLGRGVDVGVPRGRSALTCPVGAVEAWQDRIAQQHRDTDIAVLPCFPTVGRAGRIGTGPITAEALTRMVQRRVAAVAIEGRWGGRSLRAGFISSAADLDLPLETIARQSRHTTLDSLIRYIRQDDPFRRNPVGQLGL